MKMYACNLFFVLFPIPQVMVKFQMQTQPKWRAFIHQNENIPESFDDLLHYVSPCQWYSSFLEEN